ncbi:GTP cyclohydrolase II [Candidatus Roizmanbacteria bacterium]|nr:GTP cyclohydrolase II [Candidatus Roizmanbacteria bacterium]
MKRESLIERLGECPLPIRIQTSLPLSQKEQDAIKIRERVGRFILLQEVEQTYHMYVYGDKTTGQEHIALIKGLKNGENVPMRIHSSCITAETFRASNCDCAEQLQTTLDIIEKEGFGGIIRLQQEGRGNGLVGKTRQLKLMIQKGIDTAEAFREAGYPIDQRDYTVAADILHDLGVESIRLITNNPDKIQQIKNQGVKVKARIPCEVTPSNSIVRKDLIAKRDKLGHFISEKNTL